MTSLRRSLCLFLLCALPLGAAAQTKPRPEREALPPAAAPAALVKIDPDKVSVLSLLGDSVQLVSVQAARPDAAQGGEWTSAPTGGMDSALLQAIEQTIKAGALRREVKLYTSTTRALFGDPASLFVDGKLSLPGTLGEAVRQSGSAHLLLVTRSSQASGLAAALPSLPGALGANLEGPGFVIDQRPAGQIGIDGYGGLPVFAAYAFIRVALIDLSDLRLKRERSIAVATRLPVSRETAANPWGALNSEQRNAALKALVEVELPKAVSALLAK